MKVKNKGQQVGARLRKIEADNKQLLEQLGNINAWAVGAIREQRQRDELLDKVATIAVMLIKDCLGRNLTDEEHAALVEAIDGPAKKEGDNGDSATQPVEGSAAQPAGGDVSGERLESSGAQE
jgi:hypothetical protein